MKKLIASLVMMVALVGCGDRHTTVVEAPAQPVVVAAQPVYVQNTDPMAGVLTGMVIGAMMSNGTRYDGHNGYYDNHYHGPSRTVVVNKTVINKTVVNNVGQPNNNNNSASGSVSTKPSGHVSASVTAAPVAPVKTGFAARPASAPASRSSFTSRPSSSPSRSSFSSRRK